MATNSSGSSDTTRLDAASSVDYAKATTSPAHPSAHDISIEIRDADHEAFEAVKKAFDDADTCGS
jgi:hypothetical protein